jgi:hypothetical protein
MHRRAKRKLPKGCISITGSSAAMVPLMGENEFQVLRIWCLLFILNRFLSSVGNEIKRRFTIIQIPNIHLPASNSKFQRSPRNRLTSVAYSIILAITSEADEMVK